MPSPYGGVACPKGETRKQQQARETREARAVVTRVRAACVERDGRCRLAGTLLGSGCYGLSHWAHLEDHRRFKTRGQPATERHTTAGTMQLCAAHHQQYDARDIQIEFITEAGADGVVRFKRGDLSVLSIPGTRVS